MGDRKALPKAEGASWVTTRNRFEFLPRLALMLRSQAGDDQSDVVTCVSADAESAQQSVGEVLCILPGAGGEDARLTVHMGDRPWQATKVRAGASILGEMVFMTVPSGTLDRSDQGVDYLQCRHRDSCSERRDQRGVGKPCAERRCSGCVRRVASADHSEAHQLAGPSTAG
ncbi:hypothetical protein GCM10022206_51000 [Streptomyces chiangmaiensis]